MQTIYSGDYYRIKLISLRPLRLLIYTNSDSIEYVKEGITLELMHNSRVAGMTGHNMNIYILAPVGDENYRLYEFDYEGSSLKSYELDGVGLQDNSGSINSMILCLENTELRSCGGRLFLIGINARQRYGVYDFEIIMDHDRALLKLTKRGTYSSLLISMGGGITYINSEIEEYGVSSTAGIKRRRFRNNLNTATK